MHGACSLCCSITTAGGQQHCHTVALYLSPGRCCIGCCNEAGVKQIYHVPPAPNSLLAAWHTYLQQPGTSTAHPGAPGLQPGGPPGLPHHSTSPCPELRTRAACQ